MNRPPVPKAVPVTWVTLAVPVPLTEVIYAAPPTLAPATSTMAVKDWLMAIGVTGSVISM